VTKNDFIWWGKKLLYSLIRNAFVTGGVTLSAKGSRGGALSKASPPWGCA
jgi:hypothetical protein